MLWEMKTLFNLYTEKIESRLNDEFLHNSIHNNILLRSWTVCYGQDIFLYPSTVNAFFYSVTTNNYDDLPLFA